jgi:hypothetical protein
MNDELQRLYQEDIEDRRHWNRRTALLAMRDEKRRQRAAELIEQGQLVDGADYYHAALLFQHGTGESHYERALELALDAVCLGESRAKWLAAAAADRTLLARGCAQRFGTQYRIVDGARVLLPLDPETTDEERRAWDVPQWQ